jgi:hypothetical protein
MALIHGRTTRLVHLFRLIGTRAGLRPKIPKLVFDTTFLFVASGRRAVAGEADLRFGAVVEPSISDFSLSRPP